MQNGPHRPVRQQKPLPAAKERPAWSKGRSRLRIFCVSYALFYSPFIFNFFGFSDDFVARRVISASSWAWSITSLCRCITHKTAGHCSRLRQYIFALSQAPSLEPAAPKVREKRRILCNAAVRGFSSPADCLQSKQSAGLSICRAWFCFRSSRHRLQRVRHVQPTARQHTSIHFQTMHRRQYIMLSIAHCRRFASHIGSGRRL